MNISAAVQLGMANTTRQHFSDVFWDFSTHLQELKEAERLQQIKVGVPAQLVFAMRATFSLSDNHLTMLMNASLATLKRRLHQKKMVDSVASERLDRIAIVCLQAKSVFESREAATRWMSVPNQSLGYSIPLILCSTGLGAAQVRRVLQALEWGGAA